MAFPCHTPKLSLTFGTPVPCPTSLPALASSLPDSVASSPPSYGQSEAPGRPDAWRQPLEGTNVSEAGTILTCPACPPNPIQAGAPLANTHMDSSACFLASATCCSRSFSATWACRSISLKLWLLTFWAPRPFLAPSWENYVMRALPTTTHGNTRKERVPS